MFYLLKSTYDRQETGDVLINLEQVEAVVCHEKKFRDTENKVYRVAVHMKSKDHWLAMFHTLDQAKVVMKELLNNKCDLAVVDELLPQTQS